MFYTKNNTKDLTKMNPFAVIKNSIIDSIKFNAQNQIIKNIKQIK